MADGVTVDETLGTITLSVTNATIVSTNTEALVDVNNDVAEVTVDESSVRLVSSTSVVATVVVGDEAQVVTVAQGIQGPPGESGEGSALYSATNKQGATINAGSPCATHSSGIGVVYADATNDTKPAAGLVTVNVTSLAAAQIQTSGPFTLEDWTNVIGSATLAPKARYYLSTTPGKLTTTAPSTVSNVVQLCGVAVSDTTLDIQIWEYLTL